MNEEHLPIPVIDSHIHFWNPDVLRYPWLDDVPALKFTHLPHDVPAESARWTLEKCVFVQADCLPEQGIAEAMFVAELAETNPRVQGIVAFSPLELGNSVRVTLNILASIPEVKGIRRLIQSEALGFASQPAFIEGVQLLPEYGFSFDLCIRHYQLPDVITLVKACPDVAFVLDHVGKPDIKNKIIDDWTKDMRALAALPNVLCKLSGMVTEADQQAWTPDDLRPYFDHVLEAFGTDRLMFGSDAPVLRLATDYTTWLDTALYLCADLSADEQRAIFYGNAKRFYRL